MTALRRPARLLRAPLLHFVVIGAAAWLLLQVGDTREPEIVVHLGAEDVSELVRGFRLQAGRSPDTGEIRQLISGRFDEELLLARAFALGWNRSDAIVQHRLLQNQRFLEQLADGEGDATALLARAYAQEMDRSDIVVRRRLIERIKLAIRDSARERAPTEAELMAHLSRYPERFERPARIGLTHVYLSRDRRGDDLEADAAALAARLRADPPAPEDAAALGDPFLLPRELPIATESMLARRLGVDFARDAFAAPVARWTGPIESAYGLHFVFVRERRPAEPPTLDAVAAEVASDLLHEREALALRTFLDRARLDARLIVDGGAVPVDP